ncbi:MAG: ABC transporter permease [Burkholderiales bacterium]
MAVKVRNIFKKQNLKVLYRNYSFLISFIALVIIALIFNPNFLSYSSLVTLLSNSTITGIIACGMTLVIISGMIDLSVGSIVSLVAGIGVLLLNQTNDIMLTLLFCLAFGAVLGALNGLLVAYAGLASFIATLATQSAYRSIITQIGQGGPFTVKEEMKSGFSAIATGKLFGVIPFLPLFFIGVVLLIGFLLTRTKFGRYVFATGSNEHATVLAGVKTKNIKLGILTLTGLLAGLSAFLLASRMSSVTASNAGAGYELDAIAAVAIGGTSMSGGRGRLTGTFLGSLMMQMISTILIAAKVDPFLTGLVKGVIIIVAVAFQSDNRRLAK